MILFMVVAREWYLALVEGRATIFYFVTFQDTNVLPKKMQKMVVEQKSIESLAQSAFE